MALPKVCVIGAGSSGITVIKSLKENGIPFDCYEKGSDVGGNWRYKNDNGLSNIYKSLHINTHRDRMEYRDFPMPTNYADYPNHEPIQNYFLSYVDHFGLRKHIQFKNGVKKAERTEDGIWKITPERGPVKYYDALVVANGHHWSERWPNPAFPGKFSGQIIHSHSYVDPKTPVNCEGKNVVVLGMGNSAMDISVELSRPGVAKKVFLSARRGAYVIPNYLFGKPLDKLTEYTPHWVPFFIQQTLAHLLIRFGVGKMEDFGLPKPDHKFGSAHPTISQDLLVRLGRGDIKPKPVITELKGKKIAFADGTEEDADVLIYCTGYNIKFPFFDEDFLSAPNNYIPLFYKMIKPGMNNLFFVGLMQPLGAIMPLAECQGKWIAQYLTGNYVLPSKEDMEKFIERDQKKMNKRYVSSTRHTIQVDYDSFLYEMKEEMATGKKRSAKLGNHLPIEARAEFLSEGRMILQNLRDLLKRNWFAANNQFFPFILAICLALLGTGCVSKGYSYQGNPLFGWMESSGEVRTTDPFPILKRYPSFQATDFEFPVGGKYAEGYYLAQKFGAENGKFGGRKHLGEDWNAITGGDSDYAAPAYAFGNGVVSEIADYGGGWGKVVRIVHYHNVGNGDFWFLETVYAHLHTIDVEPGQLVKKTEWIGTIGDAGGNYPAHLHFELRSIIGGPLGGGYALKTEGFLPPTRWLMQYGPKEKSFSEESFQYLIEKGGTL